MDIQIRRPVVRDFITAIRNLQMVDGYFFANRRSCREYIGRVVYIEFTSLIKELYCK